MGQEKVDETLNDTTTYDQSSSVVSRIERNASPSTESYDVSSDSQATYTARDETGVTQTATVDSTMTQTRTDTVTVPGGGLPTQRSLGPLLVTASTPFPDAVGITGTASPITLVEGYDPSSGLLTAKVARSPLLLFTNNSGTVTETNIVNFTDKSVDANLAADGEHEHVLGTSQSASYETSALGAPAGILDQSIDVVDPLSAGKTTLLTMTTIGKSGDDLATMLQAVDAAIGKLTTAGAIVGAMSTRIEGQKSFNSALSDALTAGIGALTDADMNTTATRIQALQTQQQLQVQALSIANQNTSMILKLFA